VAEDQGELSVAAGQEVTLLEVEGKPVVVLGGGAAFVVEVLFLKRGRGCWSGLHAAAAAYVLLLLHMCGCCCCHGAFGLMWWR